ncbi:putative oxidoreductase [Kockovaella imperatae]|uniref:Putative oxidoreductase n=1 Tax=Kockovaella imperatae TaxID=4999 RepID=A0A1Y1UQI3_9TREE|nr:putative oxidoreductase [Kockovaella imperatae]ORX40293.1 putative oxidoreductase [Kockovaella imperatae]
MSGKVGTTQVGGRVGVVGTGHRARMYTRAVADRPDSTIVALCDLNSERIKVHQGLLKELGQPEAKTYHADDFQKMIDECKLDVLVVTTVDATHDLYIVPALKAGIRVLTEKPMTTSVEKCQRILKTVDETNGSLQVLFNYRYNPVHWKVEEVIASGKIGNVKSVHFEWLLDTVHGADYFRRWHRYKDKSGGLMVHKSSHHFDLVNFWINAKPKTVFGMGSLAFYGSENGKKSGWAKDYYRARDSKEAENDPFAIHLEDQADLKTLYADAEHVDNYHRDMNVFADDITIEDDMAVLVKYNTGATMTYHLTAYSPWEGYRVMFNGDKGRLELEVVESAYRVPQSKGGKSEGVVHGENALPQEGHKKITLQELWKQPVDVPFEEGKGGHGGGDEAMLDQIFGPRPGAQPSSTAVARLSANQIDGALAMAVGLAANESFRTGDKVEIKDLLGVEL